MSDDPVRWKDASEASAEARELLHAGERVPSMSPEDKARILDAALAACAVGVAGGAIDAQHPSASSGGAARATASSVTLKKAIFGFVGVGGIGAVVFTAWFATRPAMPSQPAPAPSVTSTAPTAPVVAPPEIAPSPAPVVSTSTLPTVPSARPKASASANAPPETNSLEVENALIGRARSLLESNPKDAAHALEQHARRFPNGELAPERDYLMIKTLRRLGRVDEARALARTHAQRFPLSPYSGYVRALLTELGE